MSQRKSPKQQDAAFRVKTHAEEPTPNRFRPWLLVGMTALCVARPLFPSESAALFGDGLTMVMLWLLLGIFWALSQIGRPDAAIRFGWTDAAVLLMLAWHTFAAWFATTHATARPAVNMLWEWWGLGMCFFMARQLIVTPRETRAVAAVMIALAVALAGYGMFQYGWEMPQTRAMYQANPDQAMRDAGMWFPAGSPERKLFEDRLASTEPTATFALTNSLAGYLAPWLIVLVGIMMGMWTHRRQRFGILALALLITSCLLLTKSRSGYAATGAGLFAVWAFCRQKRFQIGWKWPLAVGTLLTLMIVGATAIGGLDRELVAGAEKSFGYRLQYWQSSLRMIADHPVFGCGPGNFQNVYPRYKLPVASEEVADPHNFIIEIWATAGTPAALGFLLVLGCFAWQTTAKSDSPQNAGPSQDDAWPYVLAGGIGGFLLAVPIGFLSAATPSGMAVLFGIPLAGMTIAVLLSWIRNGEMPQILPAIAIGVLLVDLSAAGGIGFPAVAGTFWLLLALGLHGQPVRPLSAKKLWPLLTIAVCMGLTCYATAYRPVLDCQTEIRLASEEPSRAIEHLEAAAAADRLAVEPRRQLAAIRFEQWLRQPSAEAFQLFEKANHRLLQLSPNSSAVRLATGDWYYRAATTPNRDAATKEAIAKAVAAYRDAVGLYPNNAVYRAKLAEALEVAGDQDGFQREAKTALELDKTTPHLDKKLPKDLRHRLEETLHGHGVSDIESLK